jgi:predicted nucleic acid-binding protein
MNVYAESSALVAWVLDETTAGAVEETLGQADTIIASDLTLVECERALVRAQAVGKLSQEEAIRRRFRLEALSAEWDFVVLSGEVLERARRRFPNEPVRTLDALHIASALMARAGFPDLALLSLDKRVRENGSALGFDVLPT